jgi:hypothetical protein
MTSGSLAISFSPGCLAAIGWVVVEVPSGVSCIEPTDSNLPVLLNVRDAANRTTYIRALGVFLPAADSRHMVLCIVSLRVRL